MLGCFTDKFFFKALINLFILTFFVSCGGSDSPSSPPAPAPITIESISISPYLIELATQSTIQLEVTAVYSDNSVGDITDQVSWSLADDLIGQINSQGVLSSDSVGSTTITASINNLNASANVTVTSATLVAINIAPGSVSIAAGTSQPLQATGIYSDQSVQDLTDQVSWLSSDSAIASISPSGLLSALSSGAATVSASLNSISSSVSATVTAATLNGIYVTPGTTSLAKGSQLQLQAVGTYSDQTTQDLSSQVNWISSDSTIVSVDAQGQITGEATGSTSVTASLATLSGSSSITVTSAVLTSLNISPGSVSLANGTSTSLQVIGVYSDATSQELTSQVSWQSADQSIAEISPDGQLKGNAEGSVDITASLNGISSVINATITSATLTRIDISAVTVSLAAGTDTWLQAVGIYSDATTQDLSAQVSWQSNDVSVGTVDTTGLLTAHLPGSITVTAGFDGVTATVSIAVTPASLTTITVTPAVSSIALGTEVQYTVTGNFSDGSAQDITQQVFWALSDLAIAEPINNEAGRYKAIAEGATGVIASLNGISGSASLTVTAATLATIEINSSTNTLAAGSDLKLDVTGFFTDSSSQDVTQSVTWISSDQSVATVENEGALRAHSVGNATLTALYGQQSATLVITVTSAVLTEIEITPLVKSLPVGVSQSFIATGIYSDNSVQDITTQVTWSSSALDIMTISNSSGVEGQAVSLSSGAVTISAQKDSIVSNKTLTISNAVITNISIIPDVSVIHSGFTETFKAVGQYSDGSTKDITDEVEWTTTDANIANSISNNSSRIRGIDPGAVTISASNGSLVGLASLTVNDSTLTGISLDNQNTSIAKGTQLQYTATGHYSDSSSRDISVDVNWSSDSPSIASINNSAADKALATGVLEGAVTITAAIAGISSTTTLTVTSATLSSINIEADSNQMLVGGRLTVRANGVYSDSSVQDISGLVTWSSNSNSVASISNEQSNKGEVVAYSAGIAGISAQLAGVVSNTLDLGIQYDPDAPVSISLIASPNAIFYDNVDSATISATLKPADTMGVIADNTLVDFIITDNGVTSTVTVGTLNGVATHTLTSTQTGFISVTANIQNTTISGSTVIISVSDFNQVLNKGAYINPLIDGNNLLIGSEFGLLAYNISNRDFNIIEYQIRNGIDHLPDSPISSANLSNGVLEGGEVFWIIYILDADIVNDGVSAGILLNDSSTAKDFGFTVNYFLSN